MPEYTERGVMISSSEEGWTTGPDRQNVGISEQTKRAVEPDELIVVDGPPTSAGDVAERLRKLEEG
jgi:hypothetical protein